MTQSENYSLEEEHDDFVERLGDLDQFIGGPKPADDARDHFDLFSEPIAQAIVAVDEHLHDEECSIDFVERLADLDKFTGSTSM